MSTPTAGGQRQGNDGGVSITGRARATVAWRKIVAIDDGARRPTSGEGGAAPMTEVAARPPPGDKSPG